ncbi:hypothetical protein [Halorubrum sp. 2020YC2]|uniref:hypothetical protein n=1 Tax=Halorubrum sp. 2020YC2 TaxID=2836432 RepID=UPI001BE58FB2|nr:hypothetical protein [Halorubrum sp. 2020YC2]QWC20206.1 hypothetical protein KI388_04445 [Halorubrum sp. 2020YC2]
MTWSSLEGEWEDQPDDPAGDDLGYDLDEWERIRATGVDSEKYLYLPGDEELLREEAFLVVSPEAVADLVDNR